MGRCTVHRSRVAITCNNTHAAPNTYLYKCKRCTGTCLVVQVAFPPPPPPLCSSRGPKELLGRLSPLQKQSADVWEIFCQREISTEKILRAKSWQVHKNCKGVYIQAGNIYTPISGQLSGNVIDWKEEQTVSRLQLLQNLILWFSGQRLCMLYRERNLYM